MKTMTCREMGGECDQKIEAETAPEMILKMTEHVKEKHPAVAEKMEKMTDDEHKVWEDTFNKNWDKAPEKVVETK